MQFGRKVAENIIPHTACIKAILTVIKVCKKDQRDAHVFLII